MNDKTSAIDPPFSPVRNGFADRVTSTFKTTRTAGKSWNGPQMSAGGANTNATTMDAGTAAIIRLSNDLMFGVPLSMAQCIFFSSLTVFPG